MTVYHDRRDDPTFVGYNENTVITICELEVFGAPAPPPGEDGGSVVMGEHVQSDMRSAQTVRGCEADSITLSCAQGTIDVVEASYGRNAGADTCPHAATSDQSCHASDSTGIVKDFCQVGAPPPPPLAFPPLPFGSQHSPFVRAGRAPCRGLKKVGCDLHRASPPARSRPPTASSATLAPGRTST